MISLEMSLRGLLRNFGLKVGAISRGRFEHRVGELVKGNPMLEAAMGPMLRARASLRLELAGLERHVLGGITKAGDINLRRALCKAATVMMHRGRSKWLKT
jgi:transposase